MHKEEPWLTQNVPYGDENKYLAIPKDLQRDAEAVLNGNAHAMVTRGTRSGRWLLSWQKAEKDKRVKRNRAKRARKARRNSR